MCICIQCETTRPAYCFFYIVCEWELIILGTKIDNEFPVMINDQLIPRVHSILCLGVKLDETLNWDEHIEIVCKKVGAGIGILKRIKPYVPANT